MSETGAGKKVEVEYAKTVLRAEARAVVEFDQPQAVFILQVEWVRPVIVLIEDAELHCLEPGHHGRPPDTFFVGGVDHRGGNRSA